MKVLLVGCGKMGSSLLKGWKKAGIKSIKIVDPYLKKTWADLPKTFKPDYVVIAVKPQEIGAVYPKIKKYKATVISIAAGISINAIAAGVGNKPIIRAMPNLPATIGKGITGAFASPKVSASQKQAAGKLLKATGKLVWVEGEDDIDSVTAISGSGPAYVFLFMQHMVQAGVYLGLDIADAKKLVLETFKGASYLAEKEESLADLITKVASKGGTTEAALKVFLNKDILKSVVITATKAAKRRAKELAK
jgi:pyrroline-5-carboxylate reductase